MRPDDLAEEIGISGRTLRAWLREVYPRSDDDHASPWELTPEQVAAATTRFGPQRTAQAPVAARRDVQRPSAGHRDWYWEGNVQGAIVRYLQQQGWTIEAVADTATKAPGDDIRARRNGRTLRVEVKGWPTKDRYADPLRAAETKRTQPSTQAGHWYSQALLHVLRDLGRHPSDAVAIGLPDWPRFRNLIADTEAPLRRLGVAVLLVAEDGSVQTRIEWPQA